MGGSVAYYVDGGFEQGLGDVVSLLRLAAEVECRTGRGAVFVTREAEVVREMVRRAGFLLGTCGRWTDGGLRESLDRHCPGAVVTYSQDKPLDALRLLARAPVLCLVTTGESADPERRRQIGALPALRVDWDLTDADGAAPGLLRGPAYCLAGSTDFGAGSPPRRIGDPVSRALVAMGGSDLRGLTPLVVEALDAIATPLTVTVVVGPAFANRRAVESAAAASRHACRLLVGASNLTPAMAEADLAIATGGLTLFELAAVGTPTLAISAVEHQRARVARLAAAGVCVDLGFHAEVTRDGVSEGVRRVMVASDLRRGLSENGRRLVDGRGVHRVAEALAGELARHA